MGVASFNVPGYRADLVAAYLSAEHGIGVRGGKFCAHPLLQRFGLGDVGAVRASIGLGTSSDDVDAILERDRPADHARTAMDLRRRRRLHLTKPGSAACG